MRKPLILSLVGFCFLLSLVVCAGARVEVRPSTFPVKFAGTSMYPTIENGQLGTEQPYAFDEEPQRGDIIDFVAPPEPQKFYSKRIIATGGDTISIDGTTVTLNGVTLNESAYVSPFNQGNPSPNQHIFAVVPLNDYFVLGDNRALSFDSRWWGFVPRSSIVGRLVYLYGSPDNTHPVWNVSSVYAQANKHLTGAFFTGWSGYYTIGNAALLLFFPSSTFPVFFSSRFRKRKQKKEPQSLYQNSPVHRENRKREHSCIWLIELAFGHCRIDGSELPAHQIALAKQRSLHVFAHCFHGSQEQQIVGSYLTIENRVVVEQSSVIRAYTEEVDRHQELLLALCHEIVTILDQECVLLTIVALEGTMQWVKLDARVPGKSQPILAFPFHKEHKVS